MGRREAMVYADEVAAILSVVKETAYKIIKGLNDDLKKKGYVMEVPRRFMEKRRRGAFVGI